MTTILLLSISQLLFCSICMTFHCNETFGASLCFFSSHGIVGFVGGAIGGAGQKGFKGSFHRHPSQFESFIFLGAGKSNLK